MSGSPTSRSLTWWEFMSQSLIRESRLNNYVSYILLLLLWIIWGHKLRHICSLSPIIGCELIIVSLKNIHTIKTDFKTVLTSSTGWKNGIFYNSFNNALSQNHHQTWNFLPSYHYDHNWMSWKMCRRGIKKILIYQTPVLKRWDPKYYILRLNRTEPRIKTQKSHMCIFCLEK